MGIYSDQLLDIKSKVQIELAKLIARYGVESKFMQAKCLRIEDKNFQYNLENVRYLVEITDNELICNTGLHYHFSVLDCDKFFEVIDHLVEKHKGVENTMVIAQHTVGFYLRDFDNNYLDTIPESDVERIEQQIIDGIHTGEICTSVYADENDEEPTEYHGWWNLK